MADQPAVEEAAAAKPDAAANSSIFVASASDKELRQGEIITDLLQFEYDAATGRVKETSRPFVVVLTQDCDLLRDFEEGHGKILNGVLLYEVQPYAAAKEAGPPGRERWKVIAQNNNERFHFIEAVPAESELQKQGLPSLLVDFRRCFSMSPAEIFRQCAIEGAVGAKRRCRLEMPYREHLQSRAAFYLQRVGLPEPLKTDEA